MQIEAIIRICEHCTLPLRFEKTGFGIIQDGILCHDQYYHEGKCIESSLVPTGESWEQHHDENDNECFYTHWEVEQE